MINLETAKFSVIIGVDELKRQAPENAIAAALVISSYPLSDDEAATAFTMLSPGEARVDASLHESLLQMPAAVDALGMRLTLIRWARRLGELLAERAEERRNG